MIFLCQVLPQICLRSYMFFFVWWYKYLWSGLYIGMDLLSQKKEIEQLTHEDSTSKSVVFFFNIMF